MMEHDDWYIFCRDIFVKEVGILCVASISRWLHIQGLQWLKSDTSNQRQ